MQVNSISGLEQMFKRGGVMAITDNLRMMVKVCRLYYEENLSQKEISALMGDLPARRSAGC